MPRQLREFDRGDVFGAFFLVLLPNEC
jgi:hypothetical protein